MSDIEHLSVSLGMDPSGFVGGAQQAMSALNSLGSAVNSVQRMILPGIAGLGAAFGSRAALNQFKDYRETGDDGIEMRAKGAKEYEEALEAARGAAGHLAAVIGQQLAPNATSAAEAFATIAGWVENITIKTIDFWKSAIGAIAGTVTAWVEGFDFIGNSWDGVIEAIDTGFAFISALASNWQGLLEVAFLSAELSAVQFFNQIVYFATEVIPTTLEWLAGNWRDVFATIFDYVSTVLINLGQNIRNFFEALWGAINGEGFNFEFIGLTEGFRSTLKSLPKIAERELGPLETSIQGRLNAALDKLIPGIAGDFKSGKGGVKAGLGGFLDSIKDFITAPKPGGNLALEPMGGAASSDKFVGALQFGSKEAYSAIIKATGGGNDVQQRQLDALQAIRDNTKSKPKKATL